MCLPRHGFSLLELTAVLCLLLVLALISFPLVHNAGRASRRTACLNNLRQLNLAAIRYSQERNGVLPDRQLWQHPTRLSHSLVPYLLLDDKEETTGFTCREDHRKLPSIMDFRRTYSINLYATGSHIGKPDAHDSLTRNIGVPERLQNVRSPGRMALFMDGARNDDGGASPQASEADLSRIRFPHRGRMAVVFLDGHVELHNRESLLQETRTTPFWGAER